MRRCPGCGAPVKPRPNGGPPKVYCTKTCGTRTRERERAKRRKLIPPVKVIPSKRSFASVYREALAQGIDLLEQGDAFYECRHGSLPGDLEIACDCWKVVA